MGKSKGSEVGYCNECNKREYHSRKAAYTGRRSLRSSPGRHQGKSGLLSVYACPHGNGFHIGHSRGTEDAVGA